MKFLLSAIMGLTLSVSAFGSIDQISDSDHVELLELLNQRTQAEITDKTCDSDEQCKIAGFGSKPCGCAWSFLIYSELTTNIERFTNLVELFNSLDEENNERIGLASDCAITMPPQVSCNAETKLCVAS